MPIKSSNHPQLVVMRPKNTRKTSNSSNSSHSNKSPPESTFTSPLASPLASPLPMYVPVDPFELHTSGVFKGTLGAGPVPGSRRVDSFDVSRPTTWPHEYMSAPDHHRYQTPKLPTFAPAPKRSSPQEKKVSPPPPSAISPGMRRRLDKVTPSSYTFASDSTKLGEIPQRKWTNPWDYEEAERLNAEAAMNGHPAAPPAVEEKPGKKKGRFKKFMRRGSAAGVAA